MTSGFLTRLAVAVGIAVPNLLVAQNAQAKRPIEIGFDGALIYESSDNVKSTAITLPVPSVRVGFFVSDAVSIEPAVRFTYAHVKLENPITGLDQTSSGTSYDLTVGLLYHFSADRTRSQTFIRPFVGIRGFSGDGNSGSQASFGGAVGVKVPASNRLATRFELGFAHAAEDEPTFASSNQIFASFGLSFFAR